jgi:eukaryotic-like serine/threonine-protein kinase
VELDPNFALAYGRLGVAYTNTGDFDRAREYYRKAFALLNRVSERERLYITSHYYAHGTNEIDKAIETLQLYRRTYPRDPVPVNNLAMEYERTGQFEKSVEGYQEAIKLDPKMAVAYGNLAFAYINLDRFDEAKAVCQRALAQGFDSAFLHGALLMLAYLQQDAPAIGREAIWFRGKPEEFHVKQGAAEAAAQAGQWRKAGEYIRQAADMARQRKLNSQAGLLLAGFAAGRAEVGLCQDVRERTREALELNREAAGAAAALALCGHAAEAEALAAETQKRLPTDTLNNAVQIPAIRAVIALKAHQPERALELLQSAAPYERANGGVIYARGMAHLQRKAGAEAMADFQNLLDHKGAYMSWNSLARLGLARAAAIAGDKAKSLRSYQDFLALWKNGDPDVPLLQEAKKEYARLQ